jgi:DNA-binding protein WhiA
MNFTEKIKSEILAKPIKDDHCKLAFIAGLIRGSGVLYERDGELGLDFKANDEQTAMMLTLNFKSLFNYDIREISVSEDRLNKKDKFYLSISGTRAIEILKKLEVVKETQDDLVVNLKFFGKLTKRECCVKSFMRGLFVATGSCTLPSENERSSTGYHLEINFSHYAPAHETSEKLAEYGIPTKVVNRRDGYIVYIKSAEEIKDFLAFLPAPISVLKITDLMVNREFANNINRQKNCDLGNVNKQVEASAKQISAIDKIEQVIGLDTLKPDLMQVAKMRKDFPEDTLSELAERLNLSKSCLNHRLRKLVCIADEL